MEVSEALDSSVIGQEAHIVARELNGPRGDSSLPMEERDEYENLVLMCSIHHKVIDDHPTIFKADTLNDIKREHEQWVQQNLQNDALKHKRTEMYLGYAAELIRLADIDNWTSWTYNLFSVKTCINKENYVLMKELHNYLHSRFWDAKLESVNKAFNNYLKVSEDLLTIFDRYSKEQNNGEVLYTETFYKTSYFTEEVYQSLLRDFTFHICLVSDLALELTRAGNLIIDTIREFVRQDFRSKEGYLVVTSELQNTPVVHTAKYRDQERYLGLQDFMVARESRDYNCGSGVSKQYRL